MVQRAMRLDPHHPDWFYWSLGWAQWHTGACEAALTSMQSMAKMPGAANRTLAAIYICLGRQDEAEAAMAKALAGQPDITLAKMRVKTLKKYSDPAQAKRWLDAMMAAGMPE